MLRQLKALLVSVTPRAELKTRQRELHLEGRLIHDERGYPILQMDGGGYWSVCLPFGTQTLIGQRVSVSATRIGFNDLSVRRVTVVRARH